MQDERHIAGIVFTHALPADADLIVETLEESAFIRVDRVGSDYADVVAVEGDA